MSIPASQFRRMHSKKKGNTRVRNATIIKKYGKVFRSRLELHMYERLLIHRVKFIYQPKFQVLSKFTYRGETVASRRVTPDFWFKDLNIIVDTKGFVTDTWPLREALLKRALLSMGLEPEIRLLHTKKEVDSFVLEIVSILLNKK